MSIDRLNLLAMDILNAESTAYVPTNPCVLACGCAGVLTSTAYVPTPCRRRSSTNTGGVLVCWCAGVLVCWCVGEVVWLGGGLVC